MRSRLKTILVRLSLIGLSGLLILLVCAYAFPPSLSRLAVQGRIINDRNGHAIAYYTDPQGEWKYPTQAASVNKVMIRMLIGIEDHRFYHDPGIDPLAIARATVQMLAAGHVVSGASTLTMQVTRLLHPAPRTLPVKIIEAFQSISLTEHYSKTRILGMWLSLAPFGGNIVGVNAAAHLWFGENPNQLSPAQAALLIALCRRPEALRPDRHPHAAMIARNKVLAEAERLHLLSPHAAREAQATPVPRHWHRLPAQTPQLTAALPTGSTTTLNGPLNAALASLAQRDLTAMRPAESLAILIINARDHAIRAAYLGDWANPRRAGFLDLSRSIRSPGSALKPFLYGLAFADGLAGPNTLFRDLPANFGAYGPDDFTHNFMGVVTAASALRRSLNLPAVKLMRRYRPDRFAAHLRAAGTPLALPLGARPTLPLALGGGGISMRRLAALYAGLTTDGSITRLHWLKGQQRRTRPLLTPSIAAEVAGILTRPLPGTQINGIAWKTGTSAGNRDDWAAGFDRRSVIIVWVGRPDGGALPGAAAIDRAVPILTQVTGLIKIAPRQPLAPRHVFTLAAPPALAQLQLAYPPPGAAIADLGPIQLRATGGQRPLTFLIDGKPLASIAALSTARFTPHSPGFYRIRIIDARGHSVSAMFRVLPAHHPDQ
ncbi:penicillin-binding protein 1C [Acidiphilium sp. MT5]